MPKYGFNTLCNLIRLQIRYMDGMLKNTYTIIKIIENKK
jgi:hypothetical protein